MDHVIIIYVIIKEDTFSRDIKRLNKDSN